MPSLTALRDQLLLNAEELGPLLVQSTRFPLLLNAMMNGGYEVAQQVLQVCRDGWLNLARTLPTPVICVCAPVYMGCIDGHGNMSTSTGSGTGSRPSRGVGPLDLLSPLLTQVLLLLLAQPIPKVQKKRLRQACHWQPVFFWILAKKNVISICFVFFELISPCLPGLMYSTTIRCPFSNL